MLTCRMFPSPLFSARRHLFDTVPMVVIKNMKHVPYTATKMSLKFNIRVLAIQMPFHGSDKRANDLLIISTHEKSELICTKRAAKFYILK